MKAPKKNGMGSVHRVELSWVVAVVLADEVDDDNNDIDDDADGGDDCHSLTRLLNVKWKWKHIELLAKRKQIL